MSDDQELDRQLRQLARSSLAARAAAIDVDTDRHALATRLAGERSAPPTRGRRQWLVAAAIAALVTGGFVTIGWLRGADGGTPTGPADTTAQTATTGPATTEPTTADPAVVRAGEVVTITPSGPIERLCLDVVSLVATDGSSDDNPDGLIESGNWLVAPAGGLANVDGRSCGSTISDQPVSLVVPTDVPVGQYEMCLTRYDDPTGCAPVEIKEAAPELPDVSVVSDAALAALETKYFTRLSTDEAPYYDIVASTPGREERTLNDRERAVALSPRVLLDGWTVSLGGEGLNSRCENRTVVVSGEGEVVDTMQRELPVARSIAANSLGMVWAGRDVCPPGSRWGDPGTFFELVALDLTAENPAVVVLQTRPADPNDVWFDDGVVVSAPGELTVSSISFFGRFAAVAEAVQTERSRWHVFDLVAPGGPMPLASGCLLAGDIIGAPSFAGDIDVESSIVVVPRLCARLVAGGSPTNQMLGDGNVQVEAVGLTGSSAPNEVVWRTSVAGITADSYSRSAHVSARFDDKGTIVALLTAAGGVELQSRTFLLIGDDATEITTPGSVYSAFYTSELFSPWELATTGAG